MKLLQAPLASILLLASTAKGHLRRAKDDHEPPSHDDGIAPSGSQRAGGVEIFGLVYYPESTTSVWRSGAGLTGTIPTEVALLTKLTTLWLSSNDLTGPIPTELSRLTELITLDLDFNQLTGPLPTGLGSLTELTHLCFWDNDLTETIPTQFGYLTALNNLWLSQNRLTGTIPTELSQLSNLYGLYLDDNQLRGTVPYDICVSWLTVDCSVTCAANYCPCTQMDAPCPETLPPTDPPDSPDPPPDVCFSLATTVDVKDVGPVALRDLDVGSEVLTNAVSGTYERVYAIGHYNATSPTEYLQVSCAEDESLGSPPLEITPSHFVYLKGKAHPVRADELKVGNVMAGCTITAIDTTTRDGFMSPWTPSGKVVVNGKFLASIYADYEDSKVLFGPYNNAAQHAGVAPFRLYCNHIAPNSKFCLTHSEEGIPLGLHFWKDLFDNAVNQPSLVIQMICLSGVFMIAALAWIIERMLMVPFVLYVVVLGTNMSGLLKPRIGSK
ncbi:LRR receptor-like serine threonine-protein kinase At4g08850-like [Seminavis robusta]|uniref:LRR receptor-like serine threonine-protein kinase At4g08850-like n=1 Tax=Seminavis robusta TaxID=568900 RepID=A0A9N8EGV0_9STRA|nr:LRR receptor-like serine threonine-protein kinase At4g08850-like [Seminavis robusta]|eukprot:Sro1171_g248850.1 LRR receptor-like serine threonine-protein kinase At4g08850-like (497) ;mRNA; r:14080-15570